MQKIFSRIHAIPQLSSLGSPGIDPLSPPAFPMSKCRYWLHPQEGHPELLPPPIWVTNRAWGEPSSKGTTALSCSLSASKMLQEAG